jgi:hypothetical protein
LFSGAPLLLEQAFYQGVRRVSDQCLDQRIDHGSPESIYFKSGLASAVRKFGASARNVLCTPEKLPKIANRQLLLVEKDRQTPGSRIRHYSPDRWNLGNKSLSFDSIAMIPQPGALQPQSARDEMRIFEHDKSEQVTVPG